MTAARASTRALRAIAAGSKQTRGLHMTGPATYSNLLTSDRPSVILPRLEPVQDAKRPVAANESASSSRHFNTSRALKSVNDSSTIDFAYLPDFDPDLGSHPTGIRVPILPTTVVAPHYDLAAAVAAAEGEHEVGALLIYQFISVLLTRIAQVMLPMIHTVVDSTHVHAPAAMSEVHDNNTIDFQGMAFQVARKITGQPVESGMMRQLWAGFKDDVLGPNNKMASA